MPRHKTRKIHTLHKKHKKHTKRRKIHRKQKGGAINIYGQKVNPVITAPMQWDD